VIRLGALALIAAIPVGNRIPVPPLYNALVTGLERSGAPGAQAAIYRCGQLVWTGTAGSLDRKSGRGVLPSSRYVLASVTKTYTATMIVQLVQRGRLSLDTKLARYYPRMPNAGRITVRMLLNHTSGLPDYLYEPSFDRAAKNPRHRWSRDKLLAGVHGSDFKPGTHYEYSNTNYLALGGILVKAGGLKVETALQREIARPAGLTWTTFTYSASWRNEYAHPYDGRDHWVPGLGIPSDYVGPVWTDGGISTTAEELAHFGDALFGARLVSSASLAQMTAFNKFDVGFGLFPADFDGHHWIGNSGSYGGFESELWNDPARGVTIAVTVNRDSTSGTVWDAVARAYDRIAVRRLGCGRS
jgi:D-alanyl-D-alanine carboxypeptidase